jgi:hypothetical protein
VHTPVAKSTLRTADDAPTGVHSPTRSTWPSSLSLSSIGTATDKAMGPHDSGGKTFLQISFPAYASASHTNISTLAAAVVSSASSVCDSSSSSGSANPAEHDDAPPHRAARGIDASKREVRHVLSPKLRQIQPPITSLRISTTPARPPHTTSPDRVRSHSFDPTRAALHTRFKRNAPTTPLCSATMAHISGRAKT